MDLVSGLTLTELRNLDSPTISVEQLAEVLNIARGSAYAAVRRGELPSLHIGRAIRIPVPALLRTLGVESGRAVYPAE